MIEETDACEVDPARVLVAVLGRLRRRRDHVRAALNGNSLRIAITLLADQGEAQHRVMFTADGNTFLVQPENLLDEDYAPHVDFRCTADELRRVALLELPLPEAIERGVMVAHTALAPYDRLHKLLGEELRHVLAAEEPI